MEDNLDPPRENNIVVIPASDGAIASYRRSVPNLQPFNFGSEITTLFEEANPLTPESEDGKKKKTKPKRSWVYTKDSLSVILSALYCKCLVLLGLALPVTQVVSQAIPHSLYNGFYIYLYSGSLVFILSIHFIRLKAAIVRNILKPCGIWRSTSVMLTEDRANKQMINHYGSFYLRLGAAAFGIGSMVFSGLEFGEFFIGDNEARCRDPLKAAKPALRMLFSVLQLHFIFLNDMSIDTLHNQVILRFSLAHMLATNLCEWLSVIVEETKHDIEPHLHNHHHHTPNVTVSSNSSEPLEVVCVEDTQGLFLREASSYLFPCTIEYSLICAVTLVEMWKDIRVKQKRGRSSTKNSFKPRSKKYCHRTERRRDEQSVDCSHSQQGLVWGLLTTVYTVTTLVVFFSVRPTQPSLAALLIVLCETLIYAASLVAMLVAALQMRHLPYCVHRLNSKGSLRLGLDLALLLKAQAGIYMYNLFSGLACALSDPPAPIWPDLFSMLQTTVQTIFILHAWWKRSGSPGDQASKPGREMVTYLRVANMALWIIAITEKNRAQLRPVQLRFFGSLTWTIITHISMPLAIFYRFHSAICFFEVWRNAYRGVSAPLNQEPIFH